MAPPPAMVLAAQQSLEATAQAMPATGSRCPQPVHRIGVLCKQRRWMRLARWPERMFELDGVRLTYSYPIDPSGESDGSGEDEAGGGAGLARRLQQSMSARKRRRAAEAEAAAGPKHYVLTPRCSVELVDDDGSSCPFLRLTAQPLREAAGEQLAAQQAQQQREEAEEE